MQNFALGGDFRNRANIRHFHGRIGRRFRQYQARVGLNTVSHHRRIRGINKAEFNAKSFEDLHTQPIGSAINHIRQYGVISGIQKAHQ